MHWHDRDGRLFLFRCGLRQLLRNQQFRDFESFVAALGLSKRGEISREHELAAASR